MKSTLPIKPQFLCIILVTAVALVAFNSAQPPLEKIQEAAFNTWYEKTTPKMRTEDTEQLDILVTITVQAEAENRALASWTVPRHPNEYVSDRAMLLRVLDLIHASDVFHFKQGTGKELSVHITVRNEQELFETTIPMKVAKKSIQLLNLLKLLEVSDSLPATSRVSPSRL